jgi:hypothetical protein
MDDVFVTDICDETFLRHMYGFVFEVISVSDLLGCNAV